MKLVSPAKATVGHIKVMVECLLDRAREFAEALNRYKREEIEACIAELENSDNADRGTAIKEAVWLNKILDQLNKQVRTSFPQWKVTGV